MGTSPTTPTVALVCRVLNHGRLMPTDVAALRVMAAQRRVSLDEVFDAVVQLVTEALHADRCTLYLVDHARQELVSRAMVQPEISEIRLRVGEGVAGWVAATGEVVNVPTRHEGFREAARRVDALTGYRTTALLAAPVRDERGGLLGVLQVLNPRDVPAFDADHERRLIKLAATVAELLSSSSLASQLHPKHRQPLDFHFNHIIGSSPAMLEVYRRVRVAARTEATVLITGETGTGKELVARALHDNSARREGPFVKVDCAALPEALVESELFGHARGAFTGAERDAAGRVEVGEGGTLFLDEVGELPLPLQSRLLRLLQDRTYQRLGETRVRRADVRFVAATHRDLARAVAEGRFREDLLYRLRVVPIPLPPLRDRGAADLDRLIDHLLHVASPPHAAERATLTTRARASLHAHPWPGNVRELQHVLEAAVVLSEGQVIDVDLLPLAPQREPSASFRTPLRPLEEVTGAYIAWAVEQCDGNRSEAARALEVSRNTVARKLDPGGG